MPALRSGQTGNRAALPRLHLLTDDETLARPGWTARAVALAEAHGSRVAIHLRGPRTPASVLAGLARGLIEGLAETSEAPLLIANDRVDLALAFALDGAHLGERSLPPDVARRILGPDAWIGVSIHAPHQVDEVSQGPADYLMVGPVFATASHPGREPGGEALLSASAARATRPIIGVGGISAARVGVLSRTGAHGVAVIRSVWDAADSVGAAGRLLDALRDLETEAA